MKKEDKSTFIVAIVLVFIMSLAIFYFIDFEVSDIGNIFKPKSKMVDIPSVITTIDSGEKKETHTIKVKIALDVEKNFSKQVEKDALHTELLEIIRDLDYDDIVQIDGIDYIVGEIKEKLNVDSTLLYGVYISEFQLDNAITDERNEKFKSDKQKNVFKGLFPNVK